LQSNFVRLSSIAKDSLLLPPNWVLPLFQCKCDWTFFQTSYGSWSW